MTDLFSCTYICLVETDPDNKVRQVADLYTQWQAGELEYSIDSPIQAIKVAGRPPLPQLVPAREVPKRSLQIIEGRLALAHAITHIEFNAINLALDAVYRFRGLPKRYYADWLQVAAEEARHFVLLRDLLRARGIDYGSYPAHDGLWDAARRTAHDLVARMALVPRVLEARGLDVTPGMINKLSSLGDHEFAKNLRIIYQEEIGHVRIGNRWFRFACEQKNLEPRETFKQMLQKYLVGKPRGPFNEQGRYEAGFTEDDLADLYALSK